MAAELRELYDADPDAKRVIDVARGLEGLRRQDGIHAAAVVITREPLTEYLPIQRKPEAGGDLADAPDRHAVRDARRRGPRPAQDGLPRPAQPRRASRSRSTSSSDPRARAPTSTTCRSTTPKTFELLRARRHDRRVPARRRAGALAAALARARRRSRTSPRSSRCTGRARWPRTGTTSTPTARTAASRSRYPHPDLEEILAPTYGLMIYQEQLMRVAQQLAGLLARGGRQPPQGDGQEDPRAHRQGAHRSSSTAASRRATTASSASRSSTRSSRSPTTRSTSRTRSATGYLAYQTAYLKANYPVEYLAALLTSVKTQQGPDRGLPQRVPPARTSPCSSPTSTSRSRTSPCASAPTTAARRSASACRRSATSARASSR